MNEKILIVDCSDFSIMQHYLNHRFQTIKYYLDGIDNLARENFAREFIDANNDVQPDYVACIFDEARPTYRDKCYVEYLSKIYRAPFKPMSRRPALVNLSEAIGFNVLEGHGGRAIQVIENLKKQAQTQGLDVVVLSPDPAMLALVDKEDKTTIKNPINGRSHTYTLAEKEFGVAGELLLDFSVLTGEEKIPGFLGFSQKRAETFLRKEGGLKKFFNALEEKEGAYSSSLLKAKPAVQKMLRSISLGGNRRSAFKSADGLISLKIRNFSEKNLSDFYEKYLVVKPLVKILDTWFRSWIKSQLSICGNLAMNKSRSDYPYIVYRIRNKKNGKRYFGSSQNHEKRWSSHLNGIQNYNHSNPEIRKDAEVFGADAFEFKVVSRHPNREEMLAREQLYIAMFWGRNCYNYRRFVEISKGLPFLPLISISKNENSLLRTQNIPSDSAKEVLGYYISPHAAAKDLGISKNEIVTALDSVPNIFCNRICHTSLAVSPNASMIRGEHGFLEGSNAFDQSINIG